MFHYRKIFMLGFGFFAIGLTWSIYNAFMPLLLRDYLTSTAMIGFIMTLDNYLAIFIQPTIGALSDTIRTPVGKRLPFLLIGMPLSALGIFLLPSHTSLLTLILFLLILNLSMSIFRTPGVALMPDITPPHQRSTANGIISVMGGLGSLLAFIFGSILWEQSEAYPFYLGGVLILISLFIVMMNINEKRDVSQYEAAKEDIQLKKGIAYALSQKDILFLLLAIVCWFVGFNGVETFFTLYCEKHLSIPASDAAFSFAFSSLSFLLFAFPAGYIGLKLGKKRAILIGILGAMVILALIAFIKTLFFIRLLFIILGICWALININSYPFIIAMAPLGYIGTFTGLYYISSSLANILSPPLLGWLMDQLSFGILFLYSSFFFFLAYLCIRIVNEPPEESSFNLKKSL